MNSFAEKFLGVNTLTIRIIHTVFRARIYQEIQDNELSFPSFINNAAAKSLII